jgi:hypothetical protein
MAGPAGLTARRVNASVAPRNHKGSSPFADVDRRAADHPRERRPGAEHIPDAIRMSDGAVVGKAAIASAPVDLALEGDTLRVTAYDTRYVFALAE